MHSPLRPSLTTHIADSSDDEDEDEEERRLPGTCGGRGARAHLVGTARHGEAEESTATVHTRSE